MLKMTVNVDDENLKTIRELLGREADSLGIRFEFKPVNIKLMELTCESLNCDSEDILAVNFAFNLYKMPDESVSTENPRDTLLRHVKSTRLTLVGWEELSLLIGESSSHPTKASRVDFT